MILYFSGTGNSRLVAEKLRLPEEAMVDMAKSSGDPGVTDGCDRIVWVFPVYAWGLPDIVAESMRRLEFASGDLPHFMVCTCGDDIGLTHIQWRRLARRRGWRAVATFSVQMPNTYVTLPGFDTDSPSVAEAKLNAMPARIASIARAIRHSARVDDVVTGAVPWIKSRVLRPLFRAFLMSPRPFKATDACIGCARCAGACPVGNISMAQTHRPEWGKNCQMCLACYHVCPRHAVEYGCLTSSKGQYSGPTGR